MKKVTLILPALFFFAVTAHAQRHAPTVEMCRADEAVWGRASDQQDYSHAQAEFATKGIPNSTPVARETMKEIFARMNEMTDCASVDPAPARQNAYLAVMTFYAEVGADRYRSFILRHNLWNQFMEEDEKGLRDTK